MVDGRTEHRTPVRLIPRLDIKGPNIVKGIQLEGLRVVGNPGEFARKYYQQGADEIIFMDIVASLYERNSILPVVEEAARDIFVPLTVGGGIRSLDDIVAVLRSGADKVAINTQACKTPDFLRKAAETFGSQCIVLSVEAKKNPSGWEVYYDNGREHTGRDVLEWVVEAESLGVGEILVTSVDREGTKKGFDQDLCAEIRRRVRVPVIACGGAGSYGDIENLIAEEKADAISCATVFHYDICPIAKTKSYLADKGYEVRR